MKKRPNPLQGQAKHFPTSDALILESRPRRRKPVNHISPTNPAARAAFGRALHQIAGGCHGF